MFEWNRVWAIGKFSNYIRFYPNPGFSFNLRGKNYKWSKFYGLKHGPIRKT